ncbi:MAG: NAD(P)-dependent oxidoreductase [Nitrospirota bacterium]|nr:NAD(P)-dependent oxidoreductase [Nitrospirota bacterium]
MKALVTGAAGFIGSHLVDALVKKGYDVTCLVRKTSDRRWLEHPGLEYIFADLADSESYSHKVCDFDYIFHLAGITKATSEEAFFSANTENTRKLLLAAADGNSGLRRFIFLSSLAATGPGNDREPRREDSQPGPVSNYGRSKLGGEKAVLEYGRQIPCTIIRPPAVYGPRDRDFFLLFQTIKKGFFPYWGRCYYSMIHVEDLVRGIILAAEEKTAEGKSFFLSDDMIYTNEDIAKAISSALGVRAIKIRLPRSLMPLLAFIGQKIDKKSIINRDRINDFRFSNWTCDINKAKKELGFKPTITLREGIRWTADWYKTHRWL